MPGMHSASTLRLIDTAHEVLRRNGRVAHLQRFLEAGMSQDQVGHMRHLGVLLRPRTGWYIDPALPTDAVEAVRVGGVLGCTSSARSWGIVVPDGAGKPGAPVHVSLARGTTRMRRSTDPTRRARAQTDRHARWHWEQRLGAPADWRVDPLDALLQMAACVEYPWLVAAIDSARCGTYRKPLLDAVATERLRLLLPAHLRRAVDASDPLAEAAGETFLRLGLCAAGVRVESQVWLTELYRADLFAEGWLPIESDGMGPHSGAQAVEADRRRDAVIARLGTPPLRFTHRQAIHDTAFVVETVEAVLRRGPGFADPQFLGDTPRQDAPQRRAG